METTEKIINGTEACFLASVRDGKIQFFAPICNEFTDIIITKGEDFDKICLIRDAKLIATINCNDEYVLLNDLPDETETSKDINKLIIVKLKKEDIIFSVDDALYVVSFAD